MIVTVQAIEERLDYITGLTKSLDPIIYVDKRRTNAFDSFADMLDYEVDNYRLHLQDDIILADNFKEYLPWVLKFMENQNLDVVSLFSPARGSIKKAFDEGMRYVRYKNYVGNIAVIFSKFFVQKLRDNVANAKNTQDDDLFINEVLEKEGIKAWAHLPVIVQHNISMGSTLGHDRNVSQMTSDIFDKDFIKNKGAIHVTPENEAYYKSLFEPFK